MTRSRKCFFAKDCAMLRPIQKGQTAMPLSNTEIREFKSRAHSLKPVVIVGGKGVTDAVVAEIDQALEHHELMKIKIANGDRNERKAIAAQLCERLKAEFIQMVGQIATVYRKSQN